MMPKVDFSKLTDPLVIEIARNITKAGGTLYASKPKNASGICQYVWRNVVFQVSANPQHQCLPVMADFYLPEIYWGTKNKPISFKEKKEMRIVLDKIVDTIVNTIPKEQWAGIIRWGNALGAF